MNIFYSNKCIKIKIEFFCLEEKSADTKSVSFYKFRAVFNSIRFFSCPSQNK